MKCHDVKRRLEALADDDLTDGERLQVVQHLDSCAGCRGRYRELRDLLRQAAELPSDLVPARDLWPGIAERIARSRVVRVDHREWRRSWLAAAAAGVLAAALLAGFWLGRHGPGPEAARSDRPTAVVPVRAAEVSVDEIRFEFERARSELESALALRRSRLSPETLRVVDANLELIDDAIARISDALAANPENPNLTLRLRSAYQQQIDLLRMAARLPAEI
jgi:hypothetical protein